MWRSTDVKDRHGTYTIAKKNNDLVNQHHRGGQQLHGRVQFSITHRKAVCRQGNYTHVSCWDLVFD
jgi:hypothetical protein